MIDFARYRALIISKAEYDSDGVGFSTLMDDYPATPGPGEPFDLVDIRRTWGRDPATRLPLYVDEVGVQRYKATVATHGVAAISDEVTQVKGAVPAASLVDCKVTNAGCLATIDAVAKHFVLGVECIDPDDELPPALEPYALDVEMPSARWSELRDGMVTLGIEAAKIDAWRAANVTATPQDVADRFAAFINR